MCRVVQGPQPMSPDKGRNGICRRPGSWRNSISDSVPYQQHLVLHFTASAPLQDNLSENFSASAGPVRNTTARLPLDHCLSCPIITRERTCLCWSALPDSHPHHPASKSQPSLEGLPSRGKVDLGPGDMGLRLSFGQIWEIHFTSEPWCLVGKTETRVPALLATLRHTRPPQCPKEITCLQKLYKHKSPVPRPSIVARKVKRIGGPQEQGSWRCVQGSESNEGSWNLRQKEREVKPGGH